MKTKNYLLLFHSTTAAVRTQGWDGQTDGQTADRRRTDGGQTADRRRTDGRT